MIGVGVKLDEAANDVIARMQIGESVAILGQKSQQHGRRLGDTLRAVNGSSLRDFGTDSHQYYSYTFSYFHDDAEQIFKGFVPNKLLEPLLDCFYIVERCFTREINILCASSALTIDASMTLSEVQ